MDFSSLSSGYETIVGFISKLRDTVSQSTNLIDIYQRCLDSDYASDPTKTAEDVLADIGESTTLLGYSIPYGNTKDEIADYVNDGFVSTVTFVRFGDLLQAALNYYRDPEVSTTTIPLYVNPADTATYDEVEVEKIINVLIENRSVVENALTTVDNLLAAVEGGVDDTSLIIDRITNGLSADYYTPVREYAVQVLTAFSGHLSSTGLGAVVSGFLGFFGFDISNQNSTDGVEGCFSNTTPAQAWFGNFIDWCMTDGYTMAEWVNRHPFFVYEGLGYVIYGLFKLVKLGLSAASYWVGVWVVDTILSITGLSGAITGTTATGDGTIANAHADFSIETSATTGVYYPAISNYIYANNDSLGSSYTVFTPGSKRFYFKESNRWRINVFYKMVDPFAVMEILENHGIYLPYCFKKDDHGNGVGLIIPDPNVNINSITTAQWLDLYNDLVNDDLTYQEARVNTNAAFAASIFYAKFLDLLYMGVLSYNSSIEYGGSTIGSIDLAQYMASYTARTLCVYSETGNFGNLWMATYCCRMFDNGYPNGYDFISTFDQDDGIIGKDQLWGPIPNQGWFESQLMPLAYIIGIKGTQGFWMSYLPRISNAKGSFTISTDDQVSQGAAKTLLTGVAVAAAVVVTVLAIKYIPRFLAYRRQLGMKLDTAAFNYGDKQTQETYDYYMKLRRKARLLGISTSSAESIIGSASNLKDKLLASDNDVRATTNSDVLDKVYHSIVG